MFSLLYMIPSATLVCILFYEQSRLPDWTQMWQEDICRDPIFRTKWQTPCRYPEGGGPQVERPHFYLYLTKYFVVLLVGTISGFWVWCGKTITTWGGLFARLCGRQVTEAHV